MLFYDSSSERVLASVYAVSSVGDRLFVVIMRTNEWMLGNVVKYGYVLLVVRSGWNVLWRYFEKDMKKVICKEPVCNSYLYHKMARLDIL